MRAALVSATLLAVAHLAAVADAPDDRLERRYLACNRAAMTHHLGTGAVAACSIVAQQLLVQRFGGDFDRLLQWSRSTDGDATAEADRSPLDLGHEHYDAGRYAEAYAQFARLADCGQREAARLALQMRRYGRKLYGMEFAASADQLARWRAALNGSAHAAQRCTPREYQQDHWRHQGVG